MVGRNNPFRWPYEGKEALQPLPKTWPQPATPGRPSSGRSTRYAYGWWIAQLGGPQVIAHGGGINGFTSALLPIPYEIS
jgi:CubicO group peptidase (beta-lactamase class C family)